MISLLVIERIYGQLEINIDNISCDSRYTERGDLFVCIAGVVDDGHKYLYDAINKGATAIIAESKHLTADQLQFLVEREIPTALVPDARKAMAIASAEYFGYPANYLRLVGVTGTKGKSTTVNLIDQLLNEGLNTETGLIGTVNTRIAGQNQQLSTTTPGPWELQSMLYELAEYGAGYGTLEVSSHAVTQHRILGVNFDIAVYTNLGKDHLDYHGTMDKYLQAKGKFFSTMGTFPEKNNRPKVAVVNIDDDFSDYILEQASVQIITYGFSDSALVKGTLLKSSENNTEMEITTPWGELFINTPMVGKFNCYNILAAVSVALFEGVPISKITSLLQNPINIPGRFEKIEVGQKFTVIVDFAHTTASLENVLTAVRDMTSGRVGLVFGCGGERDKGKRPAMAKVACDYSDHLVITSDNPRTENPEAIISDILTGVYDQCTSKVQVNSDRTSAIEDILSWARPGDSVLIAGKGHETTQEVNGKIIEFDDRQVVKEKLTQMGYLYGMDWT